MRIAIVGAGISGLGAAVALRGRPDIKVTLYERESRAGGHAHTIDIDYNGQGVAVDTGFIVYNELNYPNLTALFGWAGVGTSTSDMSFALSSDDGALEWCGRLASPLGGIFAQRRNLFDVAFHRFLLGIWRFQRRAIQDHDAGAFGDEPLADYLARTGCSPRLRDDYIIPMGAAIWSMTPGDTLAFPARSFITFFRNHKLLQRDRPHWRTVTGGSRHYVDRLTQQLAGSLRTGCAVASIGRTKQGHVVRDENGATDTFDAVVLATHAPQALALLTSPSPALRAALGSFRTSVNQVVVHRDRSLMPRRKAAWASWNLLRRTGNDAAAVTYWMNSLQSLPNDCPVFVTLNPDRPIREDLIFAKMSYNHPIYDGRAIAAQQALEAVQGEDGLYFAGAWTGHGFHEDGLLSGLKAAGMLGGIAPWLR